MTDFLLELRSEEIPARMQGKAKDDLARLFNDALAKAGLAAANVETFATPRRLALIATGLPLATEAVSEETKGPKVGAPPQAMEGFLRKTGLTQDQLTTRNGIYFAVVEKPGRNTADVLAEAIPAIIRAFPWPKSQRWGAGSASTESLRWVRPLQGIVALFGDEIVQCEVDGIISGAATMGHRFHHSGPITIGNAGDYIEKLRACHVIVHFSERCAIIREGAKAAAEAAGLTLVEDEGLVAENAGLTEWPVPMLGQFDPAFLEVPQEVIQLTARVNQKYFVCKSSPARGGGPAKLVEGHPHGSATFESRDDLPVPLHHPADGSPPRSGEEQLANAFVCTANIDAHDGGAAIVAGNEKVLAARLSDAKFFWEQDLKVALESQAQKLSQITFHEKLGTVADKVDRVAKLARWLVEEGIITPLPQAGGVGGGLLPSPSQSSPVASPTPNPSRLREGDIAALADAAERAARLCKADLVTGMVGEFPELQGIMGGYYARAQGESDAVADAIRDHYKPVGQGDDVPNAPVTVAVSLADKLDSIISFFAIDEKPTGSKDPFALRRAALGFIAIILQNQLRLPLYATCANSLTGLVETALELSERLQGRLKEQESALEAFQAFVTSGLGGDTRANYDLPQLEDPDDSVELKLLLAVREFYAAGPESFLRQISDFFADRLKVQQREAGVRHDLIDAVFALGGEDDLVRLLARVKALQAFVATDEGVNLLAGYKRAANILKQAEYSSPSTSDGEGDRSAQPSGGGAPPSVAGATATSPSQVDGEESQSGPPILDTNTDAPLSDTDEQQIPQTGEEDPFVEVDQGLGAAIAGNHGRTEGTVPEGAQAADIALLGALDIAEQQAGPAIDEERFEDAMAALATLREPIDRFFDEVMVNDEDPAKRAFRLGLLARFRDAVHRVADFSKIEG